MPGEPEQSQRHLWVSRSRLVWSCGVRTYAVLAHNDLAEEHVLEALAVGYGVGLVGRVRSVHGEVDSISVGLPLAELPEKACGAANHRG